MMGRDMDALDILSILSVLIGCRNLEENRGQSEHNEISETSYRQLGILIVEVSEKIDKMAKKINQLKENIDQLMEVLL